MALVPHVLILAPLGEMPGAVVGLVLVLNTAQRADEVGPSKVARVLVRAEPSGSAQTRDLAVRDLERCGDGACEKSIQARGGNLAGVTKPLARKRSRR